MLLILKSEIKIYHGVVSVRYLLVNYKAIWKLLNTELFVELQVWQSWCLDALNNKEDFRNVIFVDESTVEMSSSGQLFFHQPESKIQKICARRPKPKHAYKVSKMLINKCLYFIILYSSIQ